MLEMHNVPCLSTVQCRVSVCCHSTVKHNVLSPHSEGIMYCAHTVEHNVLHIEV
jgi:hypothetical protein